MGEIITFASIGDFIKASDTEDVDKTSHIAGNKKFSGTATFNEAVELATRGWPKGTKRLAKLRAQLDHVVEKAVSARACTLHWDVTGDFLDVGRVLSGEAESFGGIRDDADTQPSTRVARIYANVSALGVVESESIFSAGAAIYAAVDILESLGHRVCTRTAPLEVEEGSIVTPEVQPGDDTAERRIERVLEVCKACGVSFSGEELETIVSA